MIPEEHSRIHHQAVRLIQPNLRQNPLDSRVVGSVAAC